MSLIASLVPQNPQLSVLPAEDDMPGRLCLDLESEKALQNQRQFAYMIGGPAVVVAGIKVQKDAPIFGTFVAALGIACSVWHYQAYQKVKYTTGIL
jgi:hypothetical protein